MEQVLLQSVVLGDGEGIWSLIWCDKAVGAEPKEWVASLPGWDQHSYLLPRGACDTILSVQAILLPLGGVAGAATRAEVGMAFPQV